MPFDCKVTKISAITPPFLCFFLCCFGKYHYLCKKFNGTYSIFTTVMNSSDKNATFSIIMTVYDDARKLEEYLPLFLEQEYEPDYEVIVVDESSTDDTTDVLKLLKTRYPHLYTTFLPKPNRLVTRQRLALTLGVKAAKHEWIVFTDIHTPPPSNQWLKELSEFTTDPTKLLLGYINSKTGDVRLQQFADINDARLLISKAERKKANGHNGKRLRYMRGKYDFVAVRAEQGHETLRLFERDIRGLRLLGRRVGIFVYNLFH